MAANTAKKKPAKRMTQREKDERARVKKELQAQGIIPPNKPRLNRRKFAREVWAEFDAMEPFHKDVYLRRAVIAMVSPDMVKVSEEDVGVLKLLKLAVEMARFDAKITAEGREKYSIKEWVEEVYNPIKNL